MNADEFTDATRCDGTSFGGCLHRAHVATNKNGHIAIQEIFLTDELDIRGFDHCISGHDSTDKTTRLDHT